MLEELEYMFKLFREVYHALTKETAPFMKTMSVWTATGEVETIY